MGGVRNVENEQVVTTRYSWTMSTCNKRVTLLVTDIPPQRSPYVSFFSLFSPLNMTKTKEKEQLSSPPSSERTHTHTHAQYRKISHRFDFEVIRSTRLDVAIKRSEHPGWAEPRLQQSSCFGCFHPSRHLPPIPRNVIQNPTVSYSHLAEALPSESNCIKCTLNIFLLSQICIKLNWIHRLRLAMLNASISALHGITEWICERWSWKIHSITITTPQITRRIPEEWSNPPHPANWPQRKTKENLQQLQRWAMAPSTIYRQFPKWRMMMDANGRSNEIRNGGSKNETTCREWIICRAKKLLRKRMSSRCSTAALGAGGGGGGGGTRVSTILPSSAYPPPPPPPSLLVNTHATHSYPVTANNKIREGGGFK